MRRTHHKKLKRLLHTSTLKIISQLASTYVYICVCVCADDGGKMKITINICLRACVCASTCEIFHNGENGHTKKNPRHKYICMFARCSDADCETSPLYVSCFVFFVP